MPVTEVLASRLPATLELAILALLIAVVFGGSVAIVGTLMRRTIGETVIDSLNGILLAVPDFSGGWRLFCSSAWRFRFCH